MIERRIYDPGEVRSKMKRARIEYGLSASDMSRLCGFGINQWRIYENGIRVPKKAQLSMIFMVIQPIGMLSLLNIIPDYLKEKMGSRYKNAYEKVQMINTLINSQAEGYKSSLNDTYFDNKDEISAFEAWITRGHRFELPEQS